MSSHAAMKSNVPDSSVQGKEAQQSEAQGQQEEAPASKSHRPSHNPLPAVSLPKGGGAIQSISEKFNVNAATGTASLTVPIKLTPSRSAAEPTIGLSYSSGKGNGPFGLGWSV